MEERKGIEEDNAIELKDVCWNKMLRAHMLNPKLSRERELRVEKH